MQSLLWQHTTPKAFLLRKFNLKLKSKIQYLHNSTIFWNPCFEPWSIECIWCFSQYVKSPSKWLTLCKGFWNVNNEQWHYPTPPLYPHPSTKKWPNLSLSLIFSEPVPSSHPTPNLSYPVIQLPHLSVFAARPIVELGQKDQILSADRVNLNYCQDLIQLVKYEYSFERLYCKQPNREYHHRQIHVHTGKRERTWTLTGVSNVISHSWCAITFVLTFVTLVNKGRSLWKKR